MEQAAGGVGEGLGGGDGGLGGAAEKIDGAVGHETNDSTSRDSGGGGGAAGRIRINSLSLQNDGLLSPSVAGGAASVGTLLVR